MYRYPIEHRDSQGRLMYPVGCGQDSYWLYCDDDSPVPPAETPEYRAQVEEYERELKSRDRTIWEETLIDDYGFPITPAEARKLAVPTGRGARK
jgi:hypothetical protein